MKNIYANTVFKLLKNIKCGALLLTLPDQQQLNFGDQVFPEEVIHIQIHDWSVFKKIVHRGDIGFAEAFVDGLWTTNDLEGLLRLILNNRHHLESLIYGSWLGSLVYKVRHFLHRNTRRGSKKNIHAHYDLGNPFYKLWLDPSMMYSSALFNEDPTRTLEQAQHAKCDRILDQLRCQADDHILEIGCGWGNFIERAKLRGIQTTGLTLSVEQKKYIEEEYLRKKTNPQENSSVVKLLDYRDCHDQFDGIASIEMFEAVGEAYWPTYFQTLFRCLKNGKNAVIQTIVIRDELFEKYRSETDFIQQYVFPGGMLPSPKIFEAAASKAGLVLKGQFSFGQDYAKTLRLWRDRFNAQIEAIKQLGFTDEFIRLWNFYLMYCAAGFAQQDIDVIQFTLEKPLHGT